MFAVLSRYRGIKNLTRPANLSKAYSVRRGGDSPFLYLPDRKEKKPFVNWKVTGLFVALGSYLSYSEFFLDSYAEFTSSNEENELLPIQLHYKLTQLPIYHQITHSKERDEWIKIETWEDLDHNILDKQDFGRGHKEDTYTIQDATGTSSLLSHTLAKPGGFLIKPVIFYNQATGEGVSIIHAGYRLCGYPFIVHGGILATVLNETFKRNAALSKATTSNYKGDFKVENLSISYRYPSFANQFLIVKTKKVPFVAENEKLIKLESTIESEKGKTVVKAEATLHDTGLVTKSKRNSILSYIGV